MSNFVNSKQDGATRFFSGGVAFEFTKKGLELYNPVEGEKFSDARTVVPSKSMVKNLILVIVDGCNLKEKGALELQQLLSGKGGKPVLLGYDGTSRETSQMCKLFLEEIPKQTDFSKVFTRGTQKQNKLIEYWFEAGKKWKNPQAKRMVALDNAGKFHRRTPVKK